MTARLDSSHKVDMNALDVQMSQITDANGVSNKVSDINAGNILTYNASVAATGTNLATAAAVLSGYTVVTAADGTKGVTLPATPAKGTVVRLLNNAASILKVWPDAAATINAIGSNSDLAVAANCPVELVADSATQWYSWPLLPS